MKSELYHEQYELQQKHWWFVAKKEIIISILKSHINKNNKNQQILDAGCGTGLMLPALSQFGTTYGMDGSEEAISFAKKMYSGTIKQGFLPDNIPYDEKFFDILISLDVIEHVDDDLSALINLKKRMKNDAFAIITVPALMSLWSHHDEINEHKRRYNKADFTDKLLKAGFTVEKVSYYNFLLFPIAYIVRQIHRLFNIKNGSNVNLPSPLVNKILKFIFGLEKHMLKICNLPIGVSLIATVRNKNNT